MTTSSPTRNCQPNVDDQQGCPIAAAAFASSTKRSGGMKGHQNLWATCRPRDMKSLPSHPRPRASLGQERESPAASPYAKEHPLYLEYEYGAPGQAAVLQRLRCQRVRARRLG